MSASIAHAFDPLPGGASNVARIAPANDEWRPIMPVPSDAPSVEGQKDAEILFRALPARVHKGGFEFTNAWCYRDIEGRALGYAVRVDNAGGKEVLPVTYCEGPGGARRYFAKNFPRPRPLFNLPKLKESASLPIMIVEGEKTARAAERLFPNYWVTTSPSGSKAAHMADWSAVRGRDVVIMRDNDEPGIGYADAVSRLAYEAGAASVRLVNLPPGLPEGWDVADDLPEGVTMVDIESAVANAPLCPRPPTDAPIPLFQPLPPAEPFPLATLGPLASVAGAIARQVQVPPAIAAQSVLAAASLAAQAHADVKLPFGQSRPLSLFFVTVAGSGDRKTTADNEALWPVGKHEKNLREIHAEEMKTWNIAHAAWAAEKRKIEAAKVDYAARKENLTNLGEEPPKPLAPFLKTADLTIDGLTKIWPDAHPALGIFTSEGGVFAGSHSMSDDNRLRTAAMMSELWDGKPITRLRAGDGASILAGRRLAMHVMVQPEAATQFLSDKTLRDQGLLSRMLVSAPPSLAGTRLYREPDPDDQAAIRNYGARLLALLETTPNMAQGKRNELAPVPVLAGGRYPAWPAQPYVNSPAKCRRILFRIWG